MPHEFILPFNGLNFDDIADNLQGNTLKSHGRNFANHVFVTFTNDVNTRVQVRNLIQIMANDGAITSTRKQFSDADEFKLHQTQFLFTSIYISKIGYDFLLDGDARLANVPNDASFQNGMKSVNTQNKLNDPAPAQWDAEFNRDIHVMFLLAHGQHDKLQVYTDELIAQLLPLVNNPAIDISIQAGKGITNDIGDHIEHFGYVDGISQPAFLREELRNINTNIRTNNWNPSTNLNRLIIPDPLGNGNAFGSYFIFRKLEQNVRGFKQREQALAVELGLNDRELAGAMVVGRFENGMPVTMSNDDTHFSGDLIDKDLIGKINNFNYNSDASGAKCPFHAHIRKSNPRGGAGGFENPTDEKLHLFARRGITYDDTQNGRKEPKDNPDFSEMPTKNVGLLFMCLNVDIADQFEFMQANWVNNDNFPGGGPHGIDPVIGQANNSGNQKYATEYNRPTSIQTANGFQNFVTMKGGEYFFSPSISFLANL